MRELRAGILKSNHLHRDATMHNTVLFCFIFISSFRSKRGARVQCDVRLHCESERMERTARYSAVILRTVFVVIAMDFIPFVSRLISGIGK